MKIGLMFIITLGLLLPAKSTLAATPTSAALASISIAAKNEGKAQNLRVQSSQQAVKMVKRRYPGKVLKVSSSNSGYKVKLLSKDGQVFHVKVNAKSGSMSR